MLDPLSDGRRLVVNGQRPCTLANLIARRRSVNRKYVDKLQLRIESLEALNQSNQAMAEGSRGEPRERSTTHSVTPSAIPGKQRYVDCELRKYCCGEVSGD